MMRKNNRLGLVAGMFLTLPALASEEDRNQRSSIRQWLACNHEMQDNNDPIVITSYYIMLAQNDSLNRNRILAKRSLRFDVFEGSLARRNRIFKSSGGAP